MYSPQSLAERRLQAASKTGCSKCALITTVVQTGRAQFRWQQCSRDVTSQVESGWGVCMGKEPNYHTGDCCEAKRAIFN